MSGRDCWRVTGVEGDGADQRGSPRKAEVSPIDGAPNAFCSIVAWSLVLFTRVRHERQIPHGIRILHVLLVPYGQTGQLEQRAA